MTPDELWEDGKAVEAFNQAMIENAVLRARVAELEQDKARLDWLEDGGHAFGTRYVGEAHARAVGQDNFSSAATVRAAIDAARKEGA